MNNTTLPGGGSFDVRDLLKQRRKKKSDLTAYALEGDSTFEDTKEADEPMCKVGAKIRLKLMLGFGFDVDIHNISNLSRYVGLADNGNAIRGVLSGGTKNPKRSTLQKIYDGFNRFLLESSALVSYLEDTRAGKKPKFKPKFPGISEAEEKTGKVTETGEMPSHLAHSIKTGKNYNVNLEVEEVEENVTPLNQLSFANAFRVPKGASLDMHDLTSLKEITGLWVQKNSEGFHFLAGIQTANGKRQKLIVMPNQDFMEDTFTSTKYPPYCLFLEEI